VDMGKESSLIHRQRRCDRRGRIGVALDASRVRTHQRGTDRGRAVTAVQFEQLGTAEREELRLAVRVRD
jgi:hypothetical protein